MSDVWQWWNPFYWIAGPTDTVTHALEEKAESWLSSTAGDIASGLEFGIDAMLGDLWQVIAGPLEIIVGVIVIVIVIGWALRGDLLAFASLMPGRA